MSEHVKRRRLPVEIVAETIQNGMTVTTHGLAVRIIENLEAEGWMLDYTDPPPVPLVADPKLMTHLITAGSKVPPPYPSPTKEG